MGNKKMTSKQFLDSILENINNLKGGEYLNQDNILIGIIFLVCVYIFTKAPGPLVDFLAHPFSMTILLGGSLYLFKEGNIPMSIILGLLLVISIVTKKENDIKNIMPIMNREHFTDKKEEEEEFDSDDDYDEDEEEEEDEEDENEGFSGKKYNPNNLNDTFKNLHDAIHQLENFIDTSEA
jgi:hypothetical protein